MSLSVPVSIWSPTTGNGEMGTQGTIFLITSALNFLVTTSGNFLILGPSTYTPIPATVWVENDSI